MPIGFGIVAFVGTWLIVAALSGPAICRDGWSSPSIGRQGACSRHGGVNWGFGGLAPVLGIVVGFATYSGAKRLQSRGGLIAFISDAHRLYSERSRIKSDPCPHCGASMHPTLQRQGPNAGRWFLICSRFPDCRGFADIPAGDPKVGPPSK
jgi:hypothetical protein